MAVHDSDRPRQSGAGRRRAGAGPAQGRRTRRDRSSCNTLRRVATKACVARAAVDCAELRAISHRRSPIDKMLCVLSASEVLMGAHQRGARQHVATQA